MKRMGIIHEHEIIRTKLEIQEQALKKFVQEIHDNIGQILSLAKLHLGTLDFSKPEEVAQKTFSSNQLIGKAIKDLRNLATHLDANHISRAGLLRSLQYELSFIPKERAGNTLLHVTGNIGVLSKEEELMLFRIVQETLYYFLEHSFSSQLSIEVQCLEDILTITIMNKERNAIAGQPTPLPEAYFNMLHSRSSIIGATLRVEHKSNHETAVHITFPFSNH